MIRHILFDADGVLQDIPGGWEGSLAPFLGERSGEFLRETWREEFATLSGIGDYKPLLAARLASYGVSEPVEVVYSAVWHRIDLIAESIALVGALRGAGYGVHLATNQERHRARYMRTELGYDELFDVSCYSCDLGVAKPSPDFFHRAADRIGAVPSSILFIDDSEANVAGALSVGLAAEHWHFERGHPSLLELLARHGVHP